MIANRLHRNGPALDRVTRFAIRAKLPAVNVGVAICALLTDVREHQFDMAPGARNSFMHSAERIARFVVLKFRDTPDGLPAERRMAVFARNCQRRSMRITRNLFLRRTTLSFGVKRKATQ